MSNKLPLRLVQPDEFPFPLFILDAEDKPVFRFDRAAYASRQKNLASCLSADYFRHEEKAATIKALNEQINLIRLIAAAPDLFVVLSELEECADYWSEYDVPLGIVDRIKAALAKAKGDV